MYALSVDNDAKKDLADIKQVNQKAWALIVAFLEQAAADQDLLDRLSQNQYKDDDYHVSRWVQQWKEGRNIFRLKIACLTNMDATYRIIYAFDPSRAPQHYHVLGILPRSFNYDQNDSRTRRIEDAYKRLNVPKFGRR